MTYNQSQQKLSKYHKNDCLENFTLLLMSSLTAGTVKNTHI